MSSTDGMDYNCVHVVCRQCMSSIAATVRTILSDFSVHKSAARKGAICITARDKSNKALLVA